jgi:hypothetical protein
MKGHSARHGRSRCTSKVGPRTRLHKAASVLRRQQIRAADDGRELAATDFNGDRCGWGPLTGQ